MSTPQEPQSAPLFDDSGNLKVPAEVIESFNAAQRGEFVGMETALTQPPPNP